MAPEASEISRPLTKNEDIVLRALRRSKRPLSAYQIMDHTTPKGVRAPQQVYRALEGLSDLRLIHRIETLNAYLYCEHGPHAEEAAFAVCSRCGRVDEISLAKMSPDLALSARKIGFALHSAHVELSGLCKSCQKELKREERRTAQLPRRSSRSRSS